MNKKVLVISISCKFFVGKIKLNIHCKKMTEEMYDNLQFKCIKLVFSRF